MTNAYNYLLEAGGLEEESSYPYTGERGECKFNPKKISARITNFTNIPLDENQIAAYLVKNGPLASKFPSQNKSFNFCTPYVNFFCTFNQSKSSYDKVNKLITLIHL